MHFLTMPFICFFMAFAVNVIVMAFFTCLGPVAHAEHNSKYYSAVAPPPYDGPDPLPHITVQIPVYKVHHIQNGQSPYEQSPYYLLF
jgi:hypothetical protein